LNVNRDSSHGDLMGRHVRLGEREIIEIIQGKLDLMPKMPIPFGDDVSAVDIGHDELGILKTDMLVAKTDMPPGMSLWQAARKAVVMNISDLAAKGVKPIALLVSLGLPDGLSRKDIESVGGGLNVGAREYGAYIIGGDTGEATDLTISVSLFGVARKGKVMLRSGAKLGDIVAVTGVFGKTSAGLKILLQNLKAPATMRKALVSSVLMPEARLKEGLALVETGAVTASIDSSDGLAWCLYEIRRASSVGFVIDKVPMAAEAERFAESNALDPFELAFYGGEEYELVLTVKPDLWGKARDAVGRVDGRLMAVGKVTADRKVLLKTDHGERMIEQCGYEHFVHNI